MTIAQRRVMEKERRRGEIIDAAQAVFAEDDVDRVTMEDVARRARLSRSLIYFYFRDKEDLYYAVTLRGLKLLRRRLTVAARSAEDGKERVAALARAYVSFAQSEPDLFEALSRFVARRVPREEKGSYRSACRAEGERILRGAAAVIQAGMRDGSLRGDMREPFAAAVAIWGFTHGLIQVLARGRRPEAPFYGVRVEALLEDAFELMERGIGAGVESSRSRTEISRRGAEGAEGAELERRTS
jgi:AcrR family transcriptional regulator